MSDASAILTAEPKIRSRPLKLPVLRKPRWIAYLALTAAILSIYSYPALRTARATGSRRLPSVSAEDLGLYLSLSRIEKDADGTPIEPFYGLRAPANAAGFLKFRLGPILFGVLTNFFGGRMWAALFVWNMLWWGFLCLSAIWLFERFLPRASVELVLAGVSLLSLIEVSKARALIPGWMHLPSLSGFEQSGLAYIRPFIPQIAAPLLLCYLGLQIRALQKKRMLDWLGMAFLQFFTLAAFPYATLVMVGITAVAGMWYLLSDSSKRASGVLVAYLLVCASTDVVFLLHGQGSFRTGTPGQSSFIHLQPALLPLMIGKLWVLMAILVIATALTRKLEPEVRYPLLGLGLSTMLLLLGDAVVPQRVLFLTDHAGYFVHPTIVILVVFLVSCHTPLGKRAAAFVSLAEVAVLAICLLTGVFLAKASYQAYLPRNIEQADMGIWLASGKVGPQDLVVARDEACTWVPLLSPSRVLFCRVAQCLLTPEQNRSVQRLREVLYLYFIGKNGQWLEDTSQFERYGFYYETSATGEDLNTQVRTVRAEMRPLFEQVESRDPAIGEFFQGFRRIWVVQDAANPIFVDARLNSYMDLKEKERVGSLVITSAIPAR